ncbi:hypothetical protein V6Z12_D12G062100 [Gossypium hirsutum]|uniref:Uncharacterized protein isoform X1 n=1 Tax=Gossypium hirsutum TaxID=3635 RepID=A0ABM3BBC9_GOSHI|nr:uncharacterized protein LOC107916846 isoform X1 [Gossypium hirsutum]XP_040964354.1 uncharacterized protein LOC107916846 isoform X1 [Gossypium hirsutum]XP_040964355.1 uncharacterized protein LOC107916846 isoform X1 [Gossypium hirsutum]
MEGLDTLIMRKKQSSKSSSLESNGSSSNQTSPASQWFSSKSSKKELTLDLNQPTDLLLLCRELMKEVFQGTQLLSRQTCHSVASLLSELHFCQSLSVLKCHIHLGKKVCGMHMSLENLFCFRTWI